MILGLDIIVTTTKILPNIWIYSILIIVSTLLTVLIFRLFFLKKRKFIINKHILLNIIILTAVNIILCAISQLKLSIYIAENYISYKLNLLHTKFSTISKKKIKKVYITDITYYNTPSIGGDINSDNYILGGESILTIQTYNNKYIRLSTNIDEKALYKILYTYKYIIEL